MFGILNAVLGGAKQIQKHVHVHEMHLHVHVTNIRYFDVTVCI